MTEGTSQLDSTIQVIAPENIAFEYRLAGPFVRLPAYVLDILARLGILVVAYYICVVLRIGVGGGAIGFWLLAMFLVSWFYGGLFETFMNGQTPGKRTLRIRVLSVDGRPINGMQAIVRNVLREVDLAPLITAAVFGLPPLPLAPTCLVGLIAMTLSRRYQRLGDLVCGTMVVIEQQAWRKGVVRLDDPRIYELAPNLPADLRVTGSMAQALAMYVQRREMFTVPRRLEIAQHLAVPLLEQFGLPADTDYDLLLCTVYYRVFIADPHEDEQHAARARAAMQRQPEPGIVFLSESTRPAAPSSSVRKT